jgi:hypothetical protein
VAQTLETAIVRFGQSNACPGKPTVDLIATFHFGEKSYFNELERAFDQYDLVLFEGIVQRRGQFSNNSSPFIIENRAVAQRLGLEYQPDVINYRRPNFEHADLLWRECRKLMRRQHQDSLFHLPVPEDLKHDGMDQQEFNRLTDEGRAELVRNAFAAEPGSEVELKRSEIDDMAIGSPDSPSILITERNKVALRVLRREFKPTKQRLAILYGVIHMLDFELHLVEDFGLSRLEERWLVAWDMRTPALQGVSENGKCATTSPAKTRVS